MRNAYAAKITAARSAMKNAERAELVHRVLTTVYQASAVALNEQFGFGADREYGALMDSADAEYADGKLEERYQQIIGGGAIE